MRYIYSIVLYVAVCACAQAGSPIVVTPSSDSIVACGTAELEAAMANWHLSAGGAVVQDPDGGDISFVSDLSLVEALTVFQESLGQGCGRNQSVTVSFTALDDDGDSAPLGTVTFATEDVTDPVFTTLPSFITYTCQEGIQDTLNAWVRSRGGAIAEDECSDITYTDFIWNDSGGNSGVGDIATGPYPAIVASCDYFINMSFLVVDDCDNQRAATGRFSLIDDSPPILGDLPFGLIVSCDNIPPADQVPLTDFCDPSASYTVVETSTQMGDVGDCSFHNYILRRKYIATDACGNSVQDSTVILVRDLAAPVINGEDSIIVSCTEFEAGAAFFISAIDDCSEVTIEVEDTAFTPACSTTVSRHYTVTDACGNQDTFRQHITVLDTGGPQYLVPPTDRVVACDASTDYNADFADWVQSTLASELADVCTAAQIFAAVPGSYDPDDMTTWPGQPVGDLDEGSCPSPLGFARVEEVDFVAFDECGNTTIITAQYGVVDDTPPSIMDCATDIDVVVPADGCVADVVIPAVTVTDDCSDIYTSIVRLSSMREYAIDINSETTITDVEQGVYDAVLIITDCAGNTAECNFNVSVRDVTPPVIIGCVGDQEVALTGNTCAVEYSLTSDVTATDNCTFANSYDSQLPANTANELLVYSTSQSDTLVNNETYTFTDVAPIEYSANTVTLTIAVTAPQTNGGHLYTIFGEDGVTIGVVEVQEPCEPTVLQYGIPISQYNDWATDGSITISLIAAGTVNPCTSLATDGTDGIARLSARLQYSDAQLVYQVTGSTQQAPMLLTDTSVVDLQVGASEITYMVMDASNNADSCSYTVVVTDDVPPVAVCKNAIINIPPDGEQTATLHPTLVDDGSSDECSAVTLEVIPSTFDCSQLGSELTVQLIATDVSGNSDTCTSLVKVEPLDLNPTFSAGICQDDSLRLFANAPTPTTPGSYTYEWSGPGFSSTDESPFILNASTANNGLYSVTVTGFGGCSAIGTVQVNVAPLTTPDITVLTDTVCAGDELALSATTFTGSITYEWYEQGVGQDVLVGSTTSASLILTPSAGDHFYYVIAKSENCTSNPSTAVAATVVPLPIAAVDQNFINICEEGSFSLGTTTFGPGFTYQWSGPDGFTSDKAFPEEIINATTSAAGEYNLVVTAPGNCVSDTAVTRVNIFDKPNTPVVTAGETFCEGSTVSLTVNNIANADLYTWYLNGQLYTSDTDNSLVIPNAQASISGSWQVTVRDGICTSDTSAIANIIIEDLQDVSVTNSGPGCQGDSLQLFVTFVAGAAYEWNGPNNFTSDIQNPKIAAVAGDYSVRIITGTNCETTASTTVLVSTSPVVTALSNNSQECMDGETNIVFFPTIVPTNGNYTYEWSGPNGYTADVLNPTLINPTAEINGTYTLVVVSGLCSSQPVETVVDITIIPEQPIITISQNTCVGQDVILTADIIGSNLTYTWSTPTGSAQTTEPTLTITTATVNDQGDYAVVVSDGPCSSETSLPVELVITTQPTAPTFETNSPVCQGADIVLTVLAPNDDDIYEWTGPDGSVVGMGAQLVIAEASDVAAGSYQVQLTRDGCMSPLSLPQEVIVQDAVATPAPQQQQYSICQGVTTSVEICVDATTAEPAATYALISVGDGAVIAESSSVCFTLSDLSMFEEGTNFVTLQTSKDGCQSALSTSFIVEVAGPPSIEAQIVTESQTLCEGDQIQLMAQQGPPVVDVLWYSLTGDIAIAGANNQTATASDLLPGANTLILTYSQGACMNFDADTVTIILPDELVTTDDNFVLADRSLVELDVLANDVLPSSVTITIVEPPLIGEASISGSTILYDPDSQLSGDVMLTYEVCSILCPDACEEATVTITVGDVDDCLAPTIITPNDDDINDRFEVPCLSGNTYPDSRLIVFNQWGDEVYSADNYDNSWAGTYEGKSLAVGTYFYILDLGDGSEPLHSFLIIQK